MSVRRVVVASMVLAIILTTMGTGWGFPASTLSAMSITKKATGSATNMG